jgi:hypothetical protein
VRNGKWRKGEMAEWQSTEPDFKGEKIKEKEGPANSIYPGHTPLSSARVLMLWAHDSYFAMRKISSIMHLN